MFFSLRVTLRNVDLITFIDTFYIKGYMFTCFFYKKYIVSIKAY
nr:MAG TPA: hypothetical protein [Caudoviricetes sp.]DAO01925.1 MAG TPA: hypothetical protein [Caudoviricetes sp.]DAW41746.1 MAG TPA: hypothetical protein [Caudoviricetes sp.]